MSWCRRCASALFALLLCAPVRGVAQEAPPAEPPVAAPEITPPRTLKEYTNLGVGLFAEGRYDEAIKAFTAAYVLKPNPVYQFNIAQSHRKAGRPKDALESYELFLREAPDSPLRPEALAHRQALQPAPVPRPAAPAAALAPAQTAPPRPVHRRPWFWVLVGGAAAGVVTGLAVGMALAAKDPMTSLGTVDAIFRK